MGNFQKNRSQKPSMLEEKQGQFWNLHRIPNKTSNPDFQFLFFCFYFSFFLDKKKVMVIFIRKSSLIKKIRRKSKIGIRSFVRKLMQIPKLSLFFFLALIVIDFYSFEGSKTHFTGEANVYIYICIYWVLLGGFDTMHLIKGQYAFVWYFSLHGLFYILFFV